MVGLYMARFFLSYCTNHGSFYTHGKHQDTLYLSMCKFRISEGVGPQQLGKS
jgi:hypothetical protein